MKLTTTQKELNHALSLVLKAVPSRPSHPVLANVLLDARLNGDVTLTGFDLSIGINSVFQASVEMGGTLTLPAKLLSDIISRLPDGEIILESDSELITTITSASGKYQVRGMSADEYPELPVVETDPIGIDGDVLVSLIQKVLFAASTDETKQVLTGVHVKVKDGKIELASTDGHRLSVVSEGLESSEEFELTIPVKAIRELDRMVDSKSIVTLLFDQSQSVFECGDNTLTTRLLEGQYPPYRQLIPNQFTRTATIDRKSLISSLERISVIADQKNNVVKFRFDTDSLVLSVDAADVGSGQESLTVSYSDEQLDIAFNVKYVLEGLKAMTGTEIVFSMNSATSPVVVKPLEGAKHEYLLMPISIRQ